MEKNMKTQIIAAILFASTFAQAMPGVAKLRVTKPSQQQIILSGGGTVSAYIVNDGEELILARCRATLTHLSERTLEVILPRGIVTNSVMTDANSCRRAIAILNSASPEHSVEMTIDYGARKVLSLSAE
jgi:hypothetical protein